MVETQYRLGPYNLFQKSGEELIHKPIQCKLLMLIATSHYSRKANLFVSRVEMHLIIELGGCKMIELQRALYKAGRKSSTLLKDGSIAIGDLSMLDNRTG